MSTPTVFILATIVLYLGMMLYIGARYARQNTSASDFYLGGRKLGPLVTAMSAEASDMSGWLLLGLPGVAFLSGTAEGCWTAIGLAVGTYLNWLFVAKRLRRYSEITASFTLPQFFSNRFHDKKQILSTIAALMIIVFFVPYTASGFSACGKLFGSLFGADYHIAMILSAVIIVAYTTAGGFMAASITDFIQSIIMTLALAMILIFATVQAGGAGVVAENAKALSGYLSLTASHVPGGAPTSYGFITIVSTLAWGLGYFGMPHILLRFMATKDENKLRISRRVASVWVVIAMSVAICIGMVGRTLTENGVIGTFADPETIIIQIANFLSTHGVLAAILAGVVLSGILASTMSTADSQLLAASSSVSQNILEDLLHLNLSNKKSMLIARLTVIAVSIFGVTIAWNPESSVFRIVSFAWAGFGAAFGPVILAALFWKRTTLAGAIAGMLGGGAMIFVWKFLIRPLGGAWDIYELLPAFLFAAILLVVFSLAAKKPDASVIEEFEKV